MLDRQKWPDIIWLVRHGQSAGNVALEMAEAAGSQIIDIDTRNVDVPLSPLGERQSRALGRWFRALPDAERPTVVMTSPYIRARATADLILREALFDPGGTTFVVDERLREKEFGILDRLTTAGIAAKYPEQAELRRVLGKFYYRPPGGESWCDVILRLRSVIDSLTREYRHERVLIVCHLVIVLCFRYLFERMSEDQILAIDRAHELANCSVTSYELDAVLSSQDRLALQLFNFVPPLDSGDSVTIDPDDTVPAEA
jgi:probable phosphoglycerate mutase